MGLEHDETVCSLDYVHQVIPCVTFTTKLFNGTGRKKVKRSCTYQVIVQEKRRMTQPISVVKSLSCDTREPVA